ncbi:MAG: hypothetical protein ACREOW_18635 [Thermodesulfobacteriota bacterium]
MSLLWCETGSKESEPNVIENVEKKLDANKTVVGHDGEGVNCIGSPTCEGRRCYEYPYKGQDNGSRHEAFQVFFGWLSKHG